MSPISQVTFYVKLIEKTADARVFVEENSQELGVVKDVMCNHVASLELDRFVITIPKWKAETLGWIG